MSGVRISSPAPLICDHLNKYSRTVYFLTNACYNLFARKGNMVMTSFNTIKLLESLAQESIVMESLEANGQIDEILSEAADQSSWSAEMTSDQLFESLGI